MGKEQSIIDKIQKLLNLAEGAKAIGSLQEAATAMAQAQKMLLKYNLDLSTVKDKHTKDENAMDKDITDTGAKKSEGNFTISIYSIIAKSNLCRIVVSSSRDKIDTNIFIFGTKLNIELVKYMSDSIINQLRYLEKASFKEYQGTEKRGTYRRGFYRGAVDAIGNRLREEIQEAKKLNIKVDALVRTNDVALQEKVDSTFGKGNLCTSKRTSTSSLSGKMAGYSAGSKMGLNKGIGGNNAKGQRLIG